ncbi:3-hydroxyisobutyrate dehydrogenase-like beta-hydroxyacid dehydrogenase [Rhodoblastus acidophilus]|uniref:NAD(P)-dependent oxidoreductase n=1 Tax=Rhodoblastus acidophilus TaxID=1074 RepID=UPI0022246395|nr:NAD(P)-dependent oxidoreductase [Rhodoblastus acidophilus]MCW2284697.1 3-hydroxyisobutyrate dehydrogenase-like beta-hydroxyacid dehydrogenase [Rhodoblastus acidophilus]MCW2333650.1 3-hydroxyisobutyrate dehydrogenase-like beta-hydroxyacid dehydrogenase [Rhodoblastus acidophilus]
MKIGFIGLGNMGGAIAGHLVAAGHEVTVWNRSADKAAPLVERGARQAATPAEAAEGDIVFTMLANDQAVERVVFAEDGIVRAKTHVSKIHVSMSTISVALAERLTEAHAASGGTFVAAPVFGRPFAAQAGKLAVVAAGPNEALDACEPLFKTFAQHIFRVGDAPRLANVIKLCGNFMIMSAIESLAEAMTLADRSGVDKAALLNVLTSTLFAAPIFKTYGEIILHEEFEPAGFAAPLGLKDMNLVDAAAQSARVPMPFLGVVREHLLATLARHGDAVDWSAIAKIVSDNSGAGR